MLALDDGGYAINDRLSIDGEGSSFFVFARGWLLEIIDLEQGEYSFFSNGKKVASHSERFGVFYPPFTLTRPFVKNARGTVRGVGAVDPYPDLPTTPFIFETDFSGEFTKTSQAFELLVRCEHRYSIETATNPSLISIKAKRLIDENYLIFPSISRIAMKLKVSHEHLSRQFKKDFLLSPSEYLHQLRVAEATFRLSTGEEIVDISQDVGYNDLSRFYKQFRKSTKTSPAKCRTSLNPDR